MSLLNEKIGKRSEIRTNTDIPIKIKIINDKYWYEGRMINLSRSGACIEGVSHFPAGTAIEIIATLKDPAKQYSILAHVVWADGEADRSGLRFLYAP